MLRALSEEYCNRDAFASRLGKAGVDRRKVSRLLCHCTIQFAKVAELADASDLGSVFLRSLATLCSSAQKQILSLMRLPIPPLSQTGSYSGTGAEKLCVYQLRPFQV